MDKFYMYVVRNDSFTKYWGNETNVKDILTRVNGARVIRSDTNQYAALDQQDNICWYVIATADL